MLNLHQITRALSEKADPAVTDLELHAIAVIKFRGRGHEGPPFKGLTLKGAPVMTLVGGKVIHDAR